MLHLHTYERQVLWRRIQKERCSTPLPRVELARFVKAGQEIGQNYRRGENPIPIANARMDGKGVRVQRGGRASQAYAKSVRPQESNSSWTMIGVCFRLSTM